MKTYLMLLTLVFDFGVESGMKKTQCMILGLKKDSAYDQIYDASMFKVMDFGECYGGFVVTFILKWEWIWIMILMIIIVYNEITGFNIKTNVKPDNKKS